MKLLGLHEGHDCSACLMINGEIVAAMQEERASRLKGDYGYPEKSIKYCLESQNIKVDDLDKVVLSTKRFNPVLTKIKRNANFSVNDWVEEQQKYWKPVLFENKEINYYDIFKDRKDFVYDNDYPIDHLLNGYMDKDEMEQLKQIRIDFISDKLGIDKDKISIVKHEDCHIYYAYYSAPVQHENALIFTSEGAGDYSNATVSLVINNEIQSPIAWTNENHLGHIYQYITLILGMKPAQHEYKVMGLAPYANKHEIEKSYEVFKDILKVEGFNIVYNKKPKDLYFYFKEKLEGHRFDGIAGAVQKFTENLLVEWISKCINTFNIGNVYFAGGVAQNIKACKKISEIKNLKKIYISPAAGDTSVSIGACYYQNKRGKSLSNIYLGPGYRYNEMIESDCKIIFEYSENIGAKYIAFLLVRGNIIGICSGRMEFGLRALGNRSILADPSNYDNIRKINQAIKKRDFWMPFTPTILKEREKDYIINPKEIPCPYMTMAFDSTELAKKHLKAAIHPADFTIRPQILELGQNDGYRDIIKEFEKLTGIGALLNTSFNLHGEPIVLNYIDAVDTFKRSDLDYLLLGDLLIWKK